MSAFPSFVAGAIGFIGYRVAHRLLREGRTVVGCDNYDRRGHRPLHPMVPGLSSAERTDRGRISPARRFGDASGFHFFMMEQITVPCPVKRVGLLRRSACLEFFVGSRGRRRMPGSCEIARPIAGPRIG